VPAAGTVKLRWRPGHAGAARGTGEFGLIGSGVRQVSRMISLISFVVPAGVSASALSRFMISM
jgi:hypothetical protein